MDNMLLAEIKKYLNATTKMFAPTQRSNRRSMASINITVEQMSEIQTILQQLEQHKAEPLTLERAISDHKN